MGDRAAANLSGMASAVLAMQCWTASVCWLRLLAALLLCSQTPVAGGGSTHHAVEHAASVAGEHAARARNSTAC